MNERWVTIKGRGPVKITNKYMNDFIRKETNTTLNVPSVDAKPLSNEEYNDLKDKFEKSLTKKEKEILEEYVSYGAGLSYLNHEDYDNWKQIYRFTSDKTKQGFTDRYLNDYEAFDIELDEKATKIVSMNPNKWYRNKDEQVKSNYKRIMLLRESAKNIDNIFETKGVSFDKDVIVYRKGHEDFDKMTKGYVRRGYTSTSAKSRINKQTPGGLVLGSNEFEIVIPKGMKVLFLENIAGDDLKKQHEILLPRNITYDVVLDKSKEGGYNYDKNKFINPENRYLVKAKQVDSKNIKGRYLKKRS